MLPGGSRETRLDFHRKTVGWIGVQKKGVVFSDVDGTLCFHQEAHSIREIRVNPDGMVMVEDPLHRQHLVYDVTVGAYRAYLARETRQLGHKVQESYAFILVTGARPGTVFSRKDVLDFADGVILESGGVIFDKDLRPDDEWAALLEPERQSLAAVRDWLTGQGWKLDIQGRTAAIRVRMKDNPHKDAVEFSRLCDTIELPDTLKKTTNMNHLDIILRSAGKGNAVRFWMRKHGYEPGQSFGIGDDDNDVDFLQVTGRPFVLAGAFPEALEVARREGWSITSQPAFDGINEILNLILESAA